MNLLILSSTTCQKNTNKQFIFTGKWELAVPRSAVASPDHLQPLQLSTDDAVEGLHDDAVLLDATSTLQERCSSQIKNHACN